MVCAKCQKTLKSTTLATPAVKRKNDPLSTSTKASTTSGVGKSKLLSTAAKNPYAAYSSSCETCKKRTDQGKKFCQRCAYKANSCAMCGKKLGTGVDGKGGQPIVEGQRFSAK